MKSKLKSIYQFFASLDTVTKTLLWINLIAYIFVVIQYGMDAIWGLDVEQLLTIGGVTGDSPLVSVLISMFLHYSLLHFVINMAILVLLSRTVSANFSPMEYLLVYLLAGI
ncbi:rhomboid family intramembrane serine protease, partial [Staphylococcus capitis]